MISVQLADVSTIESLVILRTIVKQGVKIPYLNVLLEYVSCENEDSGI